MYLLVPRLDELGSRLNFNFIYLTREQVIVIILGFYLSYLQIILNREIRDEAKKIRFIFI
ncbi:MAG: hypothetical protein APR63_13825 [Desulfuromonas sp. SDB]|nr:MAG: hypothetical protein APR63_13825 [Desulfuromonas sp. SDB]